MKGFKSRIFLLILGLSIVSMPFAGTLNYDPIAISQQVQSPAVMERSVASNYVPHSPVVITSDSDFISAGFSGSGSELVPYVLEGVSIPYDGTCIDIRDTTVYFEIKDCYLSSSNGVSGYGIYADNAPNGVVNSCIVESKETGVVFYSSKNTTLKNNTIFNCLHGTHFDYCEKSALINNTIYGNSYHGIYSSDERFSLFANNTVYSNSHTGMFIIVSWNCTISSNFVFHNDQWGIDLMNYAFNATVINNDVYENDWGGISLNHPEFSEVAYNTIHENDRTGLQIHYANNCTVIFNEILHNSQGGIISFGSSDNIFYGNTIAWNRPNAQDSDWAGSGLRNHWDDGVSLGNTWGDYNGSGPYIVSGQLVSVDRFPARADTTSPTIDTPDDEVFEYGMADYSLNWTPSDAHPNLFQLLKNGTRVQSDSWDGFNITVDVSDYYLGVYNFTLVAYDTCFNWVSDSVMVVVQDTTAPYIDNPSSIGYTEGETGSHIEWHVYDRDPATYEITRTTNEYTQWIISGSWSYGDWYIRIDVDYLTPGSYIYTLVVEDESGHIVSDEVSVTVHPIPTETDTTTPYQGPFTFESFTLGVVTGAAVGAVVVLILVRVKQKRM